MTTYPEEAWQRLGRCLATERGRRPRHQIAKEAGISPRSLSDYEKARKAPYVDGPPQGMRALAAYYGWTPDSIEAVLSGGQPAHRDGPPVSAEVLSAVVNLLKGRPVDDRDRAIILSVMTENGVDRS